MFWLDYSCFEECQPVLSRRELIETLPSAKKRGLKKHWEHNSTGKCRSNTKKKKKRK